MKYMFNDGGRLAAGFKGQAGDCACRAIAITTGEPYLTVYRALNVLTKSERTSIRKQRCSSARNKLLFPTYYLSD